MQYEYGSKIERPNMVTLNWNSIIQIQVGDILFLRGDERIYAVGQAIKPRISSDIVLEARKIIANNSHDIYNSREYSGIVHFSDSDVFYENLDGEENWGQRIDVDSWQYYYPAGIPAKSKDLYLAGQTDYGVLKELKADKGIQIINELMKKMGTITELKTLLESNHNLILTGAPGTGKTYLAKQLARLILFGKKDSFELSEDELAFFYEHCGFVQFHPSYDYTDFVEGLRPDENSNFELKDGVFKAFCEKALRNFEDSKMKIEDLKKQWSVKEKCDLLINQINDGTISCFQQKKGIMMDIVKVRDNGFVLQTPETKTEYSVYYDKIRALVNKYPTKDSFDKIKNINDEIKVVIKNYNASAYWAVLNKIHEITLENSVENEELQKVEEKKYVFIIDEINRGEISKIFGELFFSIDPGYRGKDGKVRTQYANMQITQNEFDKALKIANFDNYGHFFVPENVYIIGTMNDIDRSVESMDFAFRRRFAFKEIKAEETQNMLDDDSAWKDDKGNGVKPSSDIIEKIKNRMNNLNKAIWDEKKGTGIEGLSSAYHIGASYFLKLSNYKKEGGSYDFDQLWENHLNGLLFEYLRGMQKSNEKLGELKAAYNNESASDNG